MHPGISRSGHVHPHGRTHSVSACCPFAAEHRSFKGSSVWRCRRLYCLLERDAAGPRLVRSTAEGPLRCRREAKCACPCCGRRLWAEDCAKAMVETTSRWFGNLADLVRPLLRSHAKGEPIACAGHVEDLDWVPDGPLDLVVHRFDFPFLRGICGLRRRRPR